MFIFWDSSLCSRLVSGARRHDHITPVLVSFWLVLAASYWLPVRQRIIYKTAVLV